MAFDAGFARPHVSEEHAREAAVRPVRVSEPDAEPPHAAVVDPQSAQLRDTLHSKLKSVLRHSDDAAVQLTAKSAVLFRADVSALR